MRKLFHLSLCLFLSIGWAFAQQRVTGTVTSAEDGEPVTGASIVVEGTTNGTTSDIDGKFTLNNVPSSASHLLVSYIGMKAVRVTIKPHLDIILEPDLEELDEVIVVAYGTAKKSSFTGSASTIDGKKIESRPVTNVSKGLEGQATGVLSTSGSGQPGSGSSIVIRGYGSINASQTPLYVVDGIPYDGNISSINPSDIENMTILKDAASTALYGARGANGVIMITTKQGKEGKAKVTWRSTVGWSNRAVPAYETVDQKEFVQLTYESLRNGFFFNNGYTWENAEAAARRNLSSTLGGSGGELYNPFKNYSWADLIDPATGQVRPDAKSTWDEHWLEQLLNKNALRHEHQINITGGTEKTKYMFSLGYLNEDGILTTTAFQRYNARANINSEINKWFTANLNTALSNSVSNFSDYDGSSTSNVWYSAQLASPLFPLYMKDAQGNTIYNENGKAELDYGERGRAGSYSDFNPLGGLQDDKADVKRDGASLRTGFTFGSDDDSFGAFKGIKLAFNFGVDYQNLLQMRYMNMYHGNQKNAGGLLVKYNTRTQSYTFNQLLTWNRSFDKHNINLLAGHEYYSYLYNYMDAGKTNLVDGIYETAPATKLYTAETYSHNYRIESWLGRAEYNYDDKYYLSGSLRRDGSSRFHKDYRWGTFWSVGANWRISKESFMEDISWLNNLSVKASYGEQGNDAIGSYYAWQSLYDLGYANANQIGAIVTSLENQKVSWEKSGNFNAGFEAAMFDNRVRVNAEFYNRKTTDMLLNNPMALSTGFSGYSDNIGDMRNRGFEFEVRATPVKTNDLTWDLTWMGSTIKNKVLKLTSTTPEIVGGSYVIKEGMPIYTFYMSKSAGVDPATGAQLYWVYDKDDDGNITNERISSDYSKAANSRYYLGSRTPDLFGSLASDLKYKGFDLNILTTYSIGGKIYDSLYGSNLMSSMYYNNALSVHALRRWQKPGDITDVPRMNIGGSDRMTDRFLVDASYFAIKNITLGYTLPKSILNKAHISTVRLFAAADNVALFTHLKGLDPQQNFNGIGIDYVYTPNKTYTIGIEVSF